MISAILKCASVPLKAFQYHWKHLTNPLFLFLMLFSPLLCSSIAKPIKLKDVNSFKFFPNEDPELQTCWNSVNSECTRCWDYSWTSSIIRKHLIYSHCIIAPWLLGELQKYPTVWSTEVPVVSSLSLVPWNGSLVSNSSPMVWLPLLWPNPNGIFRALHWIPGGRKRHTVHHIQFPSLPMGHKALSPTTSASDD